MPVTVIVYVPLPALLATFIVRVDVPEVEIDVGLRVAAKAVGAVADSVTVPVNPLRAVTVIVEVPEDPRLMLKDAGEADIEKSGEVTCTVTIVEWFTDPFVPVTVTEYAPLAALLGTVTFNVDVPEVEIWVGLRVAVQPVGAVVDSVTVPVNPLRAVTVIVEVPEPPFPMFRVAGEAESEKSGVVEGVKLVVTGLPRPVTRS
jgi:hypothetical protein